MRMRRKRKRRTTATAWPSSGPPAAFRQEVKEQNRQLSGAAENAGVSGAVGFARFTNAGYLGMYNMMNVQLADKRGLRDKQLLLDHMGSVEMAANLFRIEMTKAKLERVGNVGQQQAEAVHRDVGSDVREMVRKNTGVNPEDLPVERQLSDITKQLKIGHKEMKKIDGSNPMGKKAVKKPSKKAGS